MKILHSADWHLDSPIVGKTDQQAQFLRAELLKIPDKIATVCKNEHCDLVLLAGDLFDGPCSAESLRRVLYALEDMAVPVFISPGNHDFCAPGSPYLTEAWPKNVHIFIQNTLQCIEVPHLNCKVWGAGYQSMDCPELLKGFHAPEDGSVHIAVLHADPQQASSPYCPITTSQIKSSGLAYLALGHIHKGGKSSATNTLCAWPGCPMGRGFDETGDKGVLLVTIGERIEAGFYPLNVPKFFDLSIDAEENPIEALEKLLPPMQTQDMYRITLTGYSTPVDTAALEASFSHVPNLTILDRTIPEVNLWDNLDADTLEGTFFRLLHDKLEDAGESYQQQIRMAARIARQILDGQEVKLP